MKASEGTEDILLIHAALAALTRLIPIPIVDDAARRHLQRRMVRALAERRRLSIWEGEIDTLAEDPRSTWKGVGRSMAMMPLRRFVRRFVLLLRGKAVIDQASRTYHTGFLVDAAFAHERCAPAGTASASEVRRAVDEVLAAVPLTTSPISGALKEGLVRSKDGLASTWERLRGTSDGTAAIERAAEDIEREGTVIEQLRRALDEVPREHFDELETRVLARLDTAGR